MLEISGKHPEKSDEELVLQFKESGNLNVLGELYSRYMHLVYGVSLKYYGDRDDAQDAVMQIFEKLITDLPRHEVQNFKSWLYVLTKNHCLMEIRSRKSAQTRLEGLKAEHEFMESGDEMHPIDRDDSSIEDALKACIEKLKAEQKQCIDLFYYQKLCYQEIAEKLQMEEKKVKSYLQNGKRNLKICLEGKNVR
ncbi:MAG: sigma-70 family RNA polymerase sigma factor [Bacteroidales bacterium]|nr:sigma-70 family RNA polymerase sigma factor [Bacteroidales bacterium]